MMVVEGRDRDGGGGDGDAAAPLKLDEHFPKHFSWT